MKKFENFKSNLSILSNAHNEDLTNKFIISGIIDMFFIQFELAWKVLKELLRYEGESVANSGSPREIIKAAYAVYDFIDEKLWISMLKERNNMAHLYDGNAAVELVDKIIAMYIPMFCQMQKEIENRYQGIIETL